MKFGNIPTNMIGSVIYSNLATETIYRVSEVDSPTGDSRVSETTVKRDVWLFNPMETNVPTEFGERINGDVGMLTQPSTDVVEGDQVLYAGDPYEVETARTFNHAGSVYTLYSLTKIQGGTVWD